MNLHNAELTTAIKNQWVGWKYDKDPCLFYTHNEGVITWLAKSRYRLRITQRTIGIYYGAAARAPMYEFQLDTKSEDPLNDFGFQKIMNDLDKGPR